MTTRPDKKMSDSVNPVPVPKKNLGQNFLVHKGTVEKIADLACRKAGRFIIELGAGTGNLTRALAERCKNVIALEIDQRLLEWHAQTQGLPGNVDLRSSDILKISYESLAAETGSRLLVAGNLPYNISTQVVFSMCRQSRFIEEAFLLFQKEVADRIVSAPGSRSYGVLSVVAQYSARTTKLLDIPPS
ncbi:MAG: ribosomal RNA small subunit methyltransferase A, partial [Thermodesulfatator sp.]